MTQKLKFQGEVVAVQPRIHLLRSFDQRSHNYLGYVVGLEGTIRGERRDFSVALGKATYAKHQFRVGDEICGECLPIPDTRKEAAEFYKVSKLRLLGRRPVSSGTPPPWVGQAPGLDTYRERGHRRLAARTYDTKCAACIWGCRMAVEIIVDHWNPSVRRWRFETFCYGPKSCPSYRPGPTRKVPGRRGMTWEEEDWIDEEETSHRGPDD